LNLKHFDRSFIALPEGCGRRKNLFAKDGGDAVNGATQCKAEIPGKASPKNRYPEVTRQRGGSQWDQSRTLAPLVYHIPTSQHGQGFFANLGSLNFDFIMI
jgi:hypothetical protein